MEEQTVNGTCALDTRHGAARLPRTRQSDISSKIHRARSRSESTVAASGSRPEFCKCHRLYRARRCWACDCGRLVFVAVRDARGWIALRIIRDPSVRDPFVELWVCLQSIDSVGVRNGHPRLPRPWLVVLRDRCCDRGGKVCTLKLEPSCTLQVGRNSKGHHLLPSVRCYGQSRDVRLWCVTWSHPRKSTEGPTI
jgi:hypothetical protein